MVGRAPSGQAGRASHGAASASPPSGDHPSRVVRATLPNDQSRWSPPLFPGSQGAADQGCVCPISQPWPGAFDFALDCPVHELQKQGDV